MPINIGDNFSYLGNSFLDNRESFDTLEDMYLCTDVPVGFITYCVENKRRYEYTENGWVEYIVSGGSGEGKREVEMSNIQPMDNNILMWINTSEEMHTEIVARINDQMTATDTTWSSEKIDYAIKNIDPSQVEIDLSDYVTKEEINNLEKIETSNVEPTEQSISMWINTSETTQIGTVARINDDTIADNTTWSSEKIDNLISGLRLVREGNTIKLMLGDIELSNILID